MRSRRGRIFYINEQGKLGTYLRPFGLSEEEVLKFLRYCIVGTSNTLVDFLSFLLLFYAFNLDTYISQAAAFIISTFNSYFWNRRFTFKSKAKMFGRNLILFYILNIITLCISLLCMYIFYDVLHIHEIVSKILTGPFVFTVNYIGNRLVIFKEDGETPVISRVFDKVKRRIFKK